MGEKAPKFKRGESHKGVCDAPFSSIKQPTKIGVSKADIELKSQIVMVDVMDMEKRPDNHGTAWSIKYLCQ